MYGRSTSLPRSFNQTCPPHAGKRIQFQSIDGITDPANHLGRSPNIVLGDPRKNAINIIIRRPADDYFHTP
jgi:hypothetical protein